MRLRTFKLDLVRPTLDTKRQLSERQKKKVILMITEKMLILTILSIHSHSHSYCKENVVQIFSAPVGHVIKYMFSTLSSTVKIIQGFIFHCIGS